MGLARPGETCWRLARAGRVRLLLDCQDYFAALRAALVAARASVHLLGWAFDPRIRLTSPAEKDDALPDEIGRLLVALADANPDLDVRLLVWRSALPISATQGFFPHRARGWFRGTRVDFRLDAEVPFGACHHQKVIIIDGALAFVGSADLMPGRWDSIEHRDNDPRRPDPGPAPTARHEVMAMVDGDAAAELGALFEARWQAAGGRATASRQSTGLDPWPSRSTPDFVDADIAIARTLPAWRGRAGVREIAALTLEAIMAAKRLIYLENQYFAWPLAVEALAARLSEPEGPEIVLVVSERSPSYFDRITMDRARATAIWRLKAGDVFGRFHALAPYTAGGRPIVVHAKAMVVDDTFIRVSSANLNNRSHGFDSECEIALEATTDAERATIAALLDRMAAHWIGRSAAELAAARGADGPLIPALWALGPPARLRPLKARRLGLLGEFIADFHVGDPAEVDDSWRLDRRRRKLLAENRMLRAAAIKPPG